MTQTTTNQTTTNKDGEIFADKAPAGKYLVNPYEEWAKAEGIPIITGAAIDLMTAQVAPWARFGVKAAFCHLDGRCDFMTVVLTELLPSSKSSLQHHLYEEVCYVLSGRGATEITLADGTQRVIEWGPKSLFAVPLNAKYRHRNDSREPARFAAVSDLRYIMNLYRSEALIFGTDVPFPERETKDLVCDLATLSLDETLGTSRARALTPADGSIAADVVEIAAGSYLAASRQVQGAHIFGVDGDGYTLVFADDAGDHVRMDWRHGVVCGAGGMRFHQHFNAGAKPARYLGVELGSRRYPMFRSRRAAYGDKTVYAAGSATIPLTEQDPRIDALWQDTLQKNGVQLKPHG